MTTQSDYVFTRDYIDNNRINLQHYHWIEQFGYHLHPQIPTTSSQLRIADVPTGTGVFLTDISARLPSTAQLDGLDISLKATPPAGWLPPNVSFRQWDIKQAVPDDLVEKYDAVHVRLLMFVLHDDEILGILQKFTKLLKPGGYLQWGEGDISSIRIEKTHPDNKIDAITQLVKIFKSQDTRLTPTWVTKLPALMESAGLDNIQVDTRDGPSYLNFAMHEASLMLPEVMVRTTRNQTFAKEVEQILPEAVEETRKGAMWSFPKCTVVGRKPTTP
ncbi:S-adenosyl-L-methionine-dependent methyltransferase [Hypomontagnella monticulosa]|nr:S-adenosyl-L-methionine-dependent methyltransferase [Hypomontagnella monticulosa]